MKNVRKAFFLILAVFLIASLTKNIFDYYQKVQFYKGFEKEYQKERKNNITFKTQILKNSDAHEVEKTLRDQLNLSKEGEYTVLIPTPTLNPIQPTPAPQPVYIQWWQTFFKN